MIIFKKNLSIVALMNHMQISKQKHKKIEKENTALILSTNASTEENPLSKCFSLKNKIDLLEKEIQLYSENKHLINGDESIEQCFKKLKKLKECKNFLLNSKNFCKKREKIFQKIK